jgi:hypothetical protein
MRPDFDGEFLSVEIPEPAAPLSGRPCRERLARRRGVSPRCSQRYVKAVPTGQTTWAALVATGWAYRGRTRDTDGGTARLDVPEAVRLRDPHRELGSRRFARPQPWSAAHE